ncbi:MAG: hypothetical protein ACREFH_16110, partial [Stellaceae bacterium]
MKKMLCVVIAICWHYTTVWAGPYMPTSSRFYSNLGYEFSVVIPIGLLGCVSEETNNGVDILLDRRLSCDNNYRNGRFVDVSANYNAAGEADTPAGLAKIYCRARKAQKTSVLNGWTLGGRAASGCLQHLGRGQIFLDLIVLRKTDPDKPEVWIK